MSWGTPVPSAGFQRPDSSLAPAVAIGPCPALNRRPFKGPLLARGGPIDLLLQCPLLGAEITAIATGMGAKRKWPNMAESGMSASELDYRHIGQSGGSVACSPSRIHRLRRYGWCARCVCCQWRVLAPLARGALGGAVTPHHQANASCGANRRSGVSLTTCLLLTVGTFQQVSPAPRRGASDQPSRRRAVPSSSRWSRGCVPSSALCGASHQADIGAA
jgi:hypothetical protein